MAPETGPDSNASAQQRPKRRALLAAVVAASALAAGGLLWAWHQGLVGPRPAPPTPKPSLQRALAYLRQGYPPDWVLKIQSHNRDFSRVVVWAGPPASEFVEEVELEWRGGAYRVGKARALGPEWSLATGPDPLAAVKASGGYANTPRTTYRVKHKSAQEATIVVESPEADPPRVEVYVEKRGDEWQVVGDDLGSAAGGP